ncbi:MAG TPA: hypothetical protein VJ842_09705 [Pyrinomonadaceae bacterium]|nr:hypothetical protein [Pyrinomonadaceae bacterium]
MQQVNAWSLYTFGYVVHAIRHIQPATPLANLTSSMSAAYERLELIIQAGGYHAPLPRRCIESAQQLHAMIAVVMNEARTNPGELINHQHLVNLRASLDFFEQALSHAFDDVPFFVATEKGTHRTSKLLVKADENLPQEVRNRLTNEIRDDIKAAGKCLAFDTPTAAGFHIIRAVEALIRAYHARATGTTLSTRSRSWGTYLTGLRKHGADQKVIGMIEHIKDFYRNPIMHPQESLTPDEALSLFHTSLSAIVQLDAATQAILAGSVPITSPPSGSTP